MVTFVEQIYFSLRQVKQEKSFTYGTKLKGPGKTLENNQLFWNNLFDNLSLGLLSSVDAQNHLSRKAGLRIKFIKLNCFEAAIDLDSSKDYLLIKKLIRGDLK